ncbi:wee1-like protein kinase [Onthophagus taurus]|uniref:wee1-like protein kinase n=1 Tax=Onthophagus taurus TaxID=166361 RepID=UPI000C206735|nr:wee1-like protein kinase [Onthophagus taurus]
MDSEFDETSLSTNSCDESGDNLPEIMVTSPVSSHNSSGVTKKCRFSPPCKRITALRLFSSTPKSPNTIIRNFTRVNLFGRTKNECEAKSDDENKTIPIPTAYDRDDKPSANVNPFTPNILLKKKRRRTPWSTTLNSSNSSSITMDDESTEEEIEQPTKKLALQETNISRYHLEFIEVDLIGEGEFGSVYKCINRMDGCEYAIKKSSKPVAGSFLEKMALNEVYAHAVLGKHQNVVRYFSAWSEDNHMIIQNEFCNTGSLAEMIAQGPLSQQELRRLLMQLAEGLRYIHLQGLVHMDIKPANIFINREIRIQCTNCENPDDSFEDDDKDEGDLIYKIGDLGHVTSIDSPHVEEGDCRYLPNEILQEDYNHLTKADIFSFGLTVIEAAGSGPLPKNGHEWHKIRSGELPEMKQTLSREFAGLLKSMIHPDPNLRPSAVQVLQHRVLSPAPNKSKLQLYKELNAEKLKYEILSKKLVEAAKCIKSLAPEAARLAGKKFNRSASTTNF